MRSSFRYPRVEAARYDRRALIAEAGSDPHLRVHACETLAEFEQLMAAARYEQTVTDGGRSASGNPTGALQGYSSAANHPVHRLGS